MNASKSKKKEGDNTSTILVLEEDIWVPPIKQRRRFSPDEAHILEREYDENPSPTQERIQQIANSIKTPRKIVTTWFQNRRAKNKRKEKSKSKENTDTPNVRNSTDSTDQSTDLDIEEADTMYKDYFLKPQEYPSPDMNEMHVLANNLPKPSSSLLMSSSELTHLYYSWVLDQNNPDQTSSHPFSVLQSPTSPSLAPNNNMLTMQHQTSVPHSFYTFEDTEHIHQNVNREKSSPSPFIPLRRCSSMAMDHNSLLSSHACIKPTDLLLEYCNVESQDNVLSLNARDHNSLMAISNGDVGMPNTNAICYEELMLLTSIGIHPKDE